MTDFGNLPLIFQRTWTRRRSCRRQAQADTVARECAPSSSRRIPPPQPRNRIHRPRPSTISAARWWRSATTSTSSPRTSSCSAHPWSWSTPGLTWRSAAPPFAACARSGRWPTCRSCCASRCRAWRGSTPRRARTTSCWRRWWGPSSTRESASSTGGCRPSARPAASRIGDLIIDAVAVEAAYRGRALKLPRQEFQLLKFLAERPGRVFSREQLLSRVWGYRYAGGTRTVDIHVRRLRAKLGPGSVMIETVRHVGYKLRPPAP